MQVISAYRFSLKATAFFLSLVISTAQAQTVLTSVEQVDMTYIREEEKLARDVYLFLYDIWQTPVFATISLSEQRHMDAMLSLLNRYGIADPAQNLQSGVFFDGQLQQLYDSLVAKGAMSEIDAIEVGIIIEETDIEDLQLAIENTQRSDIIRTYNNLLKGSRNHLSSFTNILEALGGSVGDNTLPLETSIYEPISQTLYIPAVDVTEAGEVRVYDALLRLIETVPQALEVISVTSISELPATGHASFDFATGILNIPDLVVGALTLESLEGTHYNAELMLTIGAADESIFIVKEVTQQQ